MIRINTERAMRYFSKLGEWADKDGPVIVTSRGEPRFAVVSLNHPAVTGKYPTPTDKASE